MSSIPSNLARVPNALASQIVLGSLTRTSRQVLEAQIQLASGLALNRPSDDAPGTSTVSVLDAVIERRDQELRNLSHAESVLNVVDASLEELGDLVLEAKGIGLGQIGVGSDAATRENQAKVIDALIRQAQDIANREHQGLFLFGGDASAVAPIEELAGLPRYRGVGDGLETDLGLASSLPITISGEAALGALSARVQGDRDLDPRLAADLRLVDLDGARGFGIASGSISLSVNGSSDVVDLTGAHTVQDVIDELNAAIVALDPAAGSVALDAGGDGLAVTVNAGYTITIADVDAEATAADLGLAATFAPGTTAGGDLAPRLTSQTRIGDLRDAGGAPLALGQIRIANAGQTRDVDLSGAQTVEDVQNIVSGLNLGVRVEIADTADRLNVVNELSGGSMSIGELGGTTATDLGVRSFTTTTLLADFNDGLGVDIVSGSVDPITGLPDPARDLDFRVTIKDGRMFDVDLAGDLTVGDVLASITAARDAAGILPGELSVGLATTGNGIQLVDTTGGFAVTRVEALNGSFAAENLGILGSTAGATFTGKDRATVAVDGLLTHLIGLRDALLADDEAGISLAVDRFDDDLSRITETRAEVGVRARRVADSTERQEDLRLQDIALKSQVRDLDFTEAAVRFANLQQQLQAGLVTASQASSLSLLDFLR